jgi:hypothetical protein
MRSLIIPKCRYQTRLQVMHLIGDFWTYFYDLICFPMQVSIPTTSYALDRRFLDVFLRFQTTRLRTLGSQANLGKICFISRQVINRRSRQTDQNKVYYHTTGHNDFVGGQKEQNSMIFYKLTSYSYTTNITCDFTMVSLCFYCGFYEPLCSGISGFPSIVF